jgi:hypothetical protein
MRGLAPRHTVDGMSRKRKFTHAMPVLATLAALGLTAPPAFAGSDQQITGVHGMVTFKHQGERIDAYDTKGEGWSVKAEVRWGVAGKAYAWDFGFDDFPDYQPVSIPEGAPVQLRMCYFDNGYRINCSQWQKATA